MKPKYNHKKSLPLIMAFALILSLAAITPTEKQAKATTDLSGVAAPTPIPTAAGYDNSMQPKHIRLTEYEYGRYYEQTGTWDPDATISDILDIKVPYDTYVGSTIVSGEASSYTIYNIYRVNLKAQTLVPDANKHLILKPSHIVPPAGSEQITPISDVTLEVNVNRIDTDTTRAVLSPNGKELILNVEGHANISLDELSKQGITLGNIPREFCFFDNTYDNFSYLTYGDSEKVPTGTTITPSMDGTFLTVVYPNGTVAASPSPTASPVATVAPGTPAMTEYIDCSKAKITLNEGKNTVVYNSALMNRKYYGETVDFKKPIPAPTGTKATLSMDGTKLTVTYPSGTQESGPIDISQTHTYDTLKVGMMRLVTGKNQIAYVSPALKNTYIVSDVDFTIPSVMPTTSKLTLNVDGKTGVYTDAAGKTETVAFETPLVKGKNTVYFKLAAGQVLYTQIEFDGSKGEIKEEKLPDGSIKTITTVTKEDGTVTVDAITKTAAGVVVAEDHTKLTPLTGGTFTNNEYHIDATGNKTYINQNMDSAKKVLTSVTYEEKKDGGVVYTVNDGTITTKTESGASGSLIEIGSEEEKLGYVLKDDHACLNLSTKKTISVPESVTYYVVTKTGDGVDAVLTCVSNTADITKIDAKAFLEDSVVTSLTSTKKVSEIGESAFEGSSITTLNTGGSMKKIGSKAFKKSKVKSVTLGSKVTSVGSYAFNSATKLRTFTIKNKSVKFGTGALKGTPKSVTFKLPGSKKQKKALKKRLIKAGANKKAKFK